MPIEKIEPGAPESQSADLAANNLAQLRKLFPELVTESAKGPAINVDVLKALVGDATVTDADEKYGLNWHGKRAARQLALTPSTGTLRPCPEDSVDWDTTQNLMIEGDNLEVLKLLQKSYAGKVKLIYIDPPYNTGQDFVYPDDFRDSIRNYLEVTGQLSGGSRISSNSEASGRFHTDWLNMIYPRLKLARDLMTPDGLVFVSCDDSEVGNLRHVMHEVFGEENLVAQLIWKKSYGGGAKTKHVVILHEYILCFAKDKALVGRLELPPDPKARKYYKLKDSKFEVRGPYRLQPLATNSNDARENLRYPIPYNGIEIWPEKQWQWEKTRALTALANDELSIAEQDGRWTVNYKQYLRDEDGVERGAKPFSLLEGPYTQTGTSELNALLGDAKLFPFPKPTDLIKHLVQYATPNNDFIFMDFFAGSGSSCDALLRLNAEDGGRRRFIGVQLPEPTERSDYKTIADITRARLRRVGEELRSDGQLEINDVGFRVFRLDASNIAAWSPDREDIAKSLLDQLEHVVAGRSDDDVLYEMLLKLGLDLCVPIESRAIAGKSVKSIGGGVLLACLDEQITVADAEPLALGIVSWHRDQQTAGEVTCVFRDSAFENDVAKTNLAAILEQHGIAKVRSL
jgi:adenine-specific DNA-methyltransferase